MAKYESIVTIRGTIDDLTFRNTAEGKIVGAKTGPTRERVLTDEKFAQTRNNASEFKQAIKDARLLRRALSSMLDGVRCATLNGHVNGLLYAIAKEDKLNDYGSRCAEAGDIGVMTGFDFNHALSLDTALPVKPAHSLDAATGLMKVEIPSFIAYKKKGYPKEATHFRIVSGGALVNFSNNNYSNKIQVSDLLPLSRKTPGDICLEHQLNTKPGDVLVQVVGIQLYKLVNGEAVLVKGGTVRILNAARIAVTRIEDELHEIVEEEGNEALREGNKALRQQGTEEKGNGALMGTRILETAPKMDTGTGQCVLKNYVCVDRWRTHFLTTCPFHNHNPERTMMGKQTIWVKRAAKCSDATGP